MVNIRLAFRTLRKTPFVTGVAVASLALGIGANSALFSLFDQILLRSLPVEEPRRLVNIAAPGPNPGQTVCGAAGECDIVFSYPMFRDLEQRQMVFTGIAGHVPFGASIAMRGYQAFSGDASVVSGSYFPVLGLKPALGRLFTPDDDRIIGGNHVAVLSYRYWESRLGADRSVLDQTVIVNGVPFTVIGVSPRGFEGTTLGQRPDVFVPLTMNHAVNRWWDGFENRRSYWIYLFARLERGVTPAKAESAISSIYQPIITEVEAPLQQGMSAPTMARFKAKRILLSAGNRGQSSVQQEAQTPLVLLFGITGIVLLIACANIANLLLARGAGRASEMAVRLSLGAGRRALLGQLLTESLVLALAGGALSLLVARWTLALIASLLPADSAAALVPTVRPGLVLFTGALSLGTGFLFGLFPALHSTRSDLIGTIRANTGQASGARAASRFRSSLVTVQISLAMALLASAGLFVKSLANVSRIQLGLRAEGIVSFRLSPVLSGYTPERSQILFHRLEESLAAVPGVTGVTTSRVPLLTGSSWGNDVMVEGFKRGPDVSSTSRFSEVGPGYFSLLEIPLLAGRDFGPGDVTGAPKVAIVNEAFATKFNLGRNPVGKYMATGGSDQLDIQIVGLAQNAKYSEVKQEIPPVFYLPYRQDAGVGELSFYVRARDPADLLRIAPKLVAALDPNLPVENLTTLPQQVKESVFLDRTISSLAAAFAALATLLAAIGLYGVLAYTVAQRAREIGVRMALGADSGRVRAMVLRQVGRMTLVGGLIGIGGALAIGQAARSLLFGLDGHDPAVFVGASVLLALVAFSAGLIPARRASRVHPMQALRYE